MSFGEVEVGVVSSLKHRLFTWSSRKSQERLPTHLNRQEVGRLKCISTSLYTIYYLLSTLYDLRPTIYRNGKMKNEK